MNYPLTIKEAHERLRKAAIHVIGIDRLAGGGDSEKCQELAVHEDDSAIVMDLLMGLGVEGDYGGYQG